MHRIVVMAATCGLMIGCGESSVKLAPVSGKVTMDDKPLVGATVAFQLPQPEGGKKKSGVVTGAIGKTDSEGRFTLMVPTPKGNRDGAPVGKNKVTISLATETETGSSKEPMMGPEQVPDRYNTKSDLTFEVPEGGTDKANFDLKSKGDHDTKAKGRPKTGE